MKNYRTSGEVDAMRIPKDAFYAHQVMWDGWVDVANNHTYIIGHWNYKPGIKKNVYVVSSGNKVEPFVNGVSKGFEQQSNRFMFTFKDVEWIPGAGDASKSYDDKEITSWVNDGVLQNAWIKYTFSKQETVSEVTMKLNGWRTKKYPISISVDNQQVYSGVTPQSLGYITIPFKPAKGSSLTISLAGETAQQDGFGLVEVTGKKDDAGTIGLDAIGKSRLGINEIKIYHKP